jgi:hypothetical protein
VTVVKKKKPVTVKLPVQTKQPETEAKRPAAQAKKAAPKGKKTKK